MDRIENGIYTTNDSSTETHQSFSMHYGLWEGGKCLKRILTYFHYIRYNEINVRHLNVQKLVSYIKKMV